MDIDNIAGEMVWFTWIFLLILCK